MLLPQRSLVFNSGACRYGTVCDWIASTSFQNVYPLGHCNVEYFGPTHVTELHSQWHPADAKEGAIADQRSLLVDTWSYHEKYKTYKACPLSDYANQAIALPQWICKKLLE